MGVMSPRANGSVEKDQQRQPQVLQSRARQREVMGGDPKGTDGDFIWED